MIASLSIVSLLLLATGCTEVVANSERAAEHKAVLIDIQKQAKDVGLQPGEIRKSCAMPFDCSANDFYESTGYIVDSTLTDQKMCTMFVALAEQLNYTSSWRDLHLEESEPGKKVPDLYGGCVESLGTTLEPGNVGQSEGVVFVGKRQAKTSTVNFWVQLQSVLEPDGAPKGERGYYFLMSTFE